MLKAIYFDFDGTIADTVPAIIASMKKSFRCMGLPEPTAEAITVTIGLPLEECCRIAGNLDGDTARQTAEVYRKVFTEFASDYTAIFPEVKETISWLHEKGFRMAICTSRGAPSLDQILEARGIDFGFETRVTANDGLTPKPHPQMVLTLLERMGLRAEEVLVVGDTTFDICMGNSAGCRTCAVTYGNHKRERLETASPTFIIDHFGELKDIVSSL